MGRGESARPPPTSLHAEITDWSRVSSDVPRRSQVGGDAPPFDRACGRVRVDTPCAHQLVQRRERDVVAVDLEESAQRLARVAAAEAVGAERDVAARRPIRPSVAAPRARSRWRRSPGRCCPTGIARRSSCAAVRPGAGGCGAAPRVPSRASSMKLVTLQTSAATPNSVSSSAAAAMRFAQDHAGTDQSHLRDLPGRMCIAKRDTCPRRMSRSTSAPTGIAGCAYVLVHHRDVVELVVAARRACAARRRCTITRQLVAEGRDPTRGSWARSMQPAWLVPSSCCKPSPDSVVRPAVAPIRKPRARESRGPEDQVADALEAEARIEDVERQHGHAVRAVAGGRGDPDC